jgi:triphosphoribosyl-dephospho-CoA synthase
MMNSVELANAFKAACMAELEALKPGNVHIFADGHGMTVQDFILSAEVASAVIAQPDLSLGQRILHGVQATQNAVKINTNLGIILLCAPMIHAALQADEMDFHTELNTVLSNTTIDDAEQTFAAIRLANPAGLGESAQQDVNQMPTETLLNAMQIAAPRDLIARQFDNNYADIFVALAHYRQLLSQWQRPAWAATAVHLHFMANFCDSHIVRKYGEVIAKMVQAEAAAHEADFAKAYNPKTFQTPLLAFDAALKKRGLNPGTSADMTVAVLLMAQIAKP